MIGVGEGWHNYHHTFPNDYRCSELGQKGLTIVNDFIEFFEKIGKT
jgi:stearoyl-CoA desaturase (delta-9 desaturase)